MRSTIVSRSVRKQVSGGTLTSSLARYLSSQKGFTLVELIAVVTITGLLLVIVSAIFVEIVQSNTRATVINEIREDGQYVIETLARDIRDASVVTAAGGVTAGKVLSITVSSAGGSNTYALVCTNPGDPSTQAITKNGQQLNSSRIMVDVNCNGSVDVSKSYFEMVPSSGGSPIAVRVNLVLETTGTPTHREFAGKQTLTELVSLRTYSR